MSEIHSYLLAAAALHAVACSSASDSRGGNLAQPNTTLEAGADSGAAGMDSGAVEGAPPSGLPMPPASGIAKPAGAPANLRVLDWAGFRAAISYTFDDTSSSQIEHYAELNGLGVPFSFYLITNKAAEFNNPVWSQALLDGHELGNHTRSHLNTGAPNLAEDTDAGKADLEAKFGISVYTMAAPFGAFDYVEVARTRYLINRGVNDTTIAPNGGADPFSLPCFIPATSAPASAFNAKLDALRSGGFWQTVLVHGFTGGTDGAFQPVDIGVFQEAVNYAKSFPDVWIGTVLDVGAYWRGQSAFAAATQTTEGSSVTYSWTLPEHFPPNEFLRVTVDGGTLTQANVPLLWNDHGFYEVALDRGAVTLSP